MKTIHFVSGLPRSGSTLLVNILGQNPRFQVAGTSALVDTLLLVRNNWDLMGENKAMPPEESEASKVRVLRAMLDSYHAEEYPLGMIPTVFDKSRTWLAHLEMAERLLGRKAKVLVPVRDVRDILASFEMIWRKASPTRQIQHEAAAYRHFSSAKGRCNAWMSTEGPVGIAYNRLRDAFLRGLGDRLHLVPFDLLTKSPAKAMARIYEFLEEEPFAHDFDNVEQLTKEDDAAYGLQGLHTIRRKVGPCPSRWQEVLGEAAAAYGKLNHFNSN